MEWNTFRLSGPIKSGDVVGCGWVMDKEGSKGSVYFTLNGERFENEFVGVPGEMFPFLTIQKKVHWVYLSQWVILHSAPKIC